MENAYQILAGAAEAKRPLSRPLQEDNINMHTQLEELKKTTLNAVKQQ
jgi:capsular polysaccharide biosynthesis protein